MQVTTDTNNATESYHAYAYMLYLLRGPLLLVLLQGLLYLQIGEIAKVAFTLI